MPITALQVVTAGGERKAPLDDAHRLTVRAFWAPPAGRANHLVTAFDLFADPLCPRLGDRLIDWRYDPLTDSYWHGGAGVTPPAPAFGFPPAPPERPGLTAAETAAGVQHRAPRDGAVVLVGITPRQEGDDGGQWLLELEYAGDQDPTAEAPEVEYDSVPYVVQKVQDVHGLLITNSALDPYAEGMPVDESRNQLVIVRNVPDGLWDPRYRAEFENTLNLLPYVHNVFVPDRDSAGDPIEDPANPGFPLLTAARPAPPGQARIKTLRAVRVPRARTPHPARRTWYWRLTVVLEFDGSTFTDNNGATQPVHWRAVLADAGTGQRVDGVRTGIAGGNGGTTGVPVPLDGSGRKAVWRFGPNDPRRALQEVDATEKAGRPVDRVPVSPGGAEHPRPDHCWYATKQGQPLTVPAPGLLVNVAGIDPDGPPPTVALTDPPPAHHGTVVLHPGGTGGFTFTPGTMTGSGGEDLGRYKGWTFFEYTVTQAGRASNKACCVLFVGPAMKVRVFDRYRTANWTPIAHLIAGW